MSRVPVRPSPQTAHAMLSVLSQMKERRDCKVPSHDVQRKAIEIIEAPATEHRIVQMVTPARVYRIQGTERVRLVVLYVRHYGEDNETIVDAECSCPASTICKHLLTALTCAERNGLHLDA